jgi:hypothetical protein
MAASIASQFAITINFGSWLIAAHFHPLQRARRKKMGRDRRDVQTNVCTRDYIRDTE